MSISRIIGAVLLIALQIGTLSQAYSQKWVPYAGSIPDDAVVGGTENGQPLYVGRIAFKGGLHPGKILPGGICNIGWGGKEYSFNDGFEILTAPAKATSWVEYRGSVPVNAVPGGFNDAAKSQPLYVAKHAYMGGEHPGKLWANACNIGYGGQEVVLKDKIFILVAVPIVMKTTKDDWTCVAIGGNGQVWGVNTQDRVFRWNGTDWEEPTPGMKLRQISAGADQLWGVNAANQIWRWTDDKWVTVPGALKQIDVAADGSVFGVTSAGKMLIYIGSGWLEVIPGGPIGGQ